MRRPSHLVFVFLSWLAACAGSHDERDFVVVASPEPADSSEGAVVRGATPAVSATARVIQCGSAQCKLDAEVCCIAETEGEPVSYCANVGLSGPRAEGERALDRVIRDGAACEAAAPPRLRNVPAGLARAQLRCDDSDDCGAEGTCCTGSSGSDLVIAFCDRPGGDWTCGDVELCRDQSCRSRGTTCCPDRGCNRRFRFVAQLVGVCAPSVPHVACGGGACTEAAPICCWEPNRPVCSTAAECQTHRGPGAPWECTRREDCGSMTCCITMDGEMGAECRFACDGQLQSPACERDADCATASGAPMRCRPVGRGPAGVKRCQPG